jgi:ribosomal protein L37AE/L43A
LKCAENLNVISLTGGDAMTEKLKPCPFCAGDKISESVSGHHICNKCGAAASSWNHRPLESKLANIAKKAVAENDKLRAVVSNLSDNYASYQGVVERLRAELAQARAAAEKLVSHMAHSHCSCDYCPIHPKIDGSRILCSWRDCKRLITEWAYAPEVEG